MSTSPLAAPTKYTSRGLTKVYWLPAVADTTAVTRSELNAGTDLSGSLADSSGWSVSANQIKTPDLATRYDSTIPGVITADDSTITLYASKDGVDGRTLMPRDETGFVVWMDGGDVVAHKCDVFPVTVSAVSKMRQVAGKDADTIKFTFAITSEPSVDVAVPS